MRPQSAKAKGRRLQQEIRDAVLAAFPSLEPDDVRSTSMGASGADLLLSPAARRLFPYYVECKNVESLNIHKAIAQASQGASRNVGGVTPLVVFRKNATPTFVALSWEAFIDLQKRASQHLAANLELERSLARDVGPKTAAWLARGEGEPDARTD